MIIAENSAFHAIQSTAFAAVGSAHEFRTADLARLEIEPAGEMAMPSCRITNRHDQHYRLSQPMLTPGNGKFPPATSFPKMMITKIEDAYCLPFGPPFLPASRQIVTDYLIPWAPDAVGWFTHVSDTNYIASVTLDTSRIEFEIETAFYLDHSISGHFGHFVGDCLPRLYAWDLCRALFGDVKVIIAAGAISDFHTHLLNAAGVPSRDIVRIKGLVRCKRLLLATQSLGVEHYASPTSSRLWAYMRDRSAVRDVALPDRVYFSRAGAESRCLVNEKEVERIFERFGFTILRPEALGIEMQIALVSNARLVAGPSGSGMFNLAFQGRMRSAFLLVWEKYIQMSEMLLCAGRGSDITYHVGHSVASGTSTKMDTWAVDLERLENDVAEWLIITRG